MDRREARLQLIAEMNELIRLRNIVNTRHTNGFTPLVKPITGLKQINRAVMMARKYGGYEQLIQNAGF